MPNVALLKGRKEPITPKLLHKFFEEKAEELPDSVALIFEDENEPEREMTFSVLNNKSNQLANKILEIIKINNLDANSDRDWIIGLCMKPSNHLITAMLATWKAGAAYLPLDDTFPRNLIKKILDEADPLMVIYDGDFKHPEYFSTKAFKFEELKRESESLSSANIDDLETVTKGRFNMALIIYTSGTSGSPKGVRLRHLTCQHRLEWQWKEFPFHATETHCLFRSAVLFIDHFGEIWNPLLAGKTVVVVPEEATRDPERIVQILEKFSVQRVTTLPSLLQQILTNLTIPDDKQIKRLMNLKLWINSGETLTLSLANDFFNYFNDGQPKLATFYGLTELMGDVLTYTIESKDQLEGLESVPIGKPTHTNYLYIFNEDRKVMKEGETGEIYLAGGNLADGYVGDPDSSFFTRNHLSLVPVRARLFQTGDFGMVKDGVVFFKGRRDQQIKIQGYRVDVNELESFMRRRHYVERCVLQVTNQGEIDQSLLMSVIVRRDYVSMSEADIENDLKQDFPSYMVPRVNILFNFPYLPNGKVDMQKLINLYKRKSEQSQSTIREIIKFEMSFKDVPENQLRTAEKLFQIIGETIGQVRDPLSLKSNFFLIGGNSLNTILCVNKLLKERLQVSLTDFIKAENVGEILESIDGGLSTRSSTACSILSTEINLHVELLDHKSKSQCIELVATSYVEKGELDQYLVGLELKHFFEYLEPMWDVLIEKELSFLVLDEHDRIVGVSINYEIDEDYYINQVPPLLKTILEFYEFVEHDILSKKPFEDKVLKAFLMGTEKSLNSAENIQVARFVEDHILKVAKAKLFKAVITTNANQLAQQIDESILGYKTLKTFQINRYVDSAGKRPFKLAEDFQKTKTMWKDIDCNEKQKT